jgi:hypothetical protein
LIINNDRDSCDETKVTNKQGHWHTLSKHVHWYAKREYATNNRAKKPSKCYVRDSRLSISQWNAAKREVLNKCVQMQMA